MTRQAFPSILLSVAIVCFFAVALYRRDPDPPVAGKTAAHSRAKTREDSVAVRTIGLQDRRPIRPAQAPVPGRLDSGASILPAGSGAEPRKVVSAVSRVAERSPAVERPSRPPAQPAMEPRPSTVKAGRPALTVARSGETIADVARRVYGREIGAEALLRANREVVRDRETAIPAGTVLRTPVSPSR